MKFIDLISQQINYLAVRENKETRAIFVNEEMWYLLLSELRSMKMVKDESLEVKETILFGVPVYRMAITFGGSSTWSLGV